tara:strand:- start:493 stop:993 length:501 start_codon:yes stop_codon:yes gene_type:complete
MFKLIKLETIGLIICILSLFVAYIYFDLIEGLAACTLCVLDRLIIFIIASIFLISLLTKNRYFFKTLFSFNLLLCSFGIISTIRHIWLQYFYDETVMEGFGCGGGFFYYITTLPLLDALKNIFDNPTPCNEIKWQLFGLSIPMYTFILFLILTIITIKILLRGKND